VARSGTKRNRRLLLHAYALLPYILYRDWPIRLPLMFFLRVRDNCQETES